MSLDDLREADQRTLRFTPDGIGHRCPDGPEDSAEFQRQVVAQFEQVLRDWFIEFRQAP
jgi:hypothetical protein